MIISTRNGQLTIYDTKIDTDTLIKIQRELISLHGSRSIIKKCCLFNEVVDEMLEPRMGIKKVVISKQIGSSLNVGRDGRSNFIDLYDLEYEEIELTPLGSIIEKILDGDLSAIPKLTSEISSKQEEEEHTRDIAQKILAGDPSIVWNPESLKTELKPIPISLKDTISRSKDIAECITLEPVYCNDFKHYCDALEFLDQFNDKKTQDAIGHFSKMAKIGNQIVDTLDHLKTPPKQYVFKNQSE